MKNAYTKQKLRKNRKNTKKPMRVKFVPKNSRINKNPMIA